MNFSKNTIAAALISLSASLPVAASSLDAIHIATSAPSEAVKWYVEHLECATVQERPWTAACPGINLEFLARTSVGSTQGTGINHISFSYADVRAKMDQLESVGVRGSGVRLQRFEDGSTIQALPGLYEHGYIFDPWGTRIELVGDTQRTGFHHVHLESTDPEAAIIWYAETLGGSPGRYKDQIPGLMFGDVWVLVDQYGEGRPAPTNERAIDHLSFVLGDLQAAVGTLTDQGMQVSGPEVPDYARSQARRAFVSGPDGVLLALVEPGWAGVDTQQAMADEAARAALAAAEAAYDVPQTPWGESDMQGIWTSNSSHGIPLERPEDLDDASELTAEQAAARRERGTLGSIWGYEREWRDTTLGYVKTAPSTQVAMIIDPPDGRMPEMTPLGKERAAMRAEARANPKLAGGPEDLTNYVRCITRGLPSMMMPSIYNNGLQIVQSPGYVAIQKEMIHETRIIPTRAKPASGAGIKQWLGSSQGYWEGDTLVIEVTDFNGRAKFQGAGENLKLTERYTRVGPTRLKYEFTVDDPTIWTSPWTGMFHFDLDNDQYDLVEYACHEGNYGMFNILSAARAREREQQADAGGE